MEENNTNQPIIDNIEDLNEEKVYFEWISPERAFQRRNKDFWITAIAILVLVSVIFVMIQEFYLVIALISLLFLYYVLSTVPPENIKNKLTNRGIYFGELHYNWDLLERFWFGKSMGWDAVFIETKLRFPAQISIIYTPEDRETLKELIVKRIPYLESSPTFVDKLTKWFAERLPLESRVEGNTNNKKK